MINPPDPSAVAPPSAPGGGAVSSHVGPSGPLSPFHTEGSVWPCQSLIYRLDRSDCWDGIPSTGNIDIQH